jgi:hypothetical protein
VLSLLVVFVLLVLVLFVVEFDEFVEFPAEVFAVPLFVEFAARNIKALPYLSSLIKESKYILVLYMLSNSVLFISAN